MASHVKAADTDADGQLDFDEYMAYVRAREGSDLTDEALWGALTLDAMALVRSTWPR